ncbi:MAG: quinolinate synthase [Kiritimatiellae bacterium]|nr:quinolinate synthase [Kiritimatiellia bacterium]
MNPSPLLEKINTFRREWGERLLILGHHYQTSEVVACCDAVGDSLELSRLAAQSKAERIIFCGVRFMAETADILIRDANGNANGRSVWQPAPTAGCPMADMADGASLEAAWQTLQAIDPTTPLTPVVYVNSNAEVKAVCGKHGGSTCTSGNGHRVVKHFLNQGHRILFAPDQHLCTNIMRELGYPTSAVALWRRELPNGGLTAEQVLQARLIAWDGCCPIHASYTTGDIQVARLAHPDAELLIHPEAPSAVAALADHTGSTKGIIDTIQRADPDRTFIVGTEEHLVERLKRTAGKTIFSLRPILCTDMGLTTLEQILSVFETWDETCHVVVPHDLVADARISVERMLAL